MVKVSVKWAGKKFDDIEVDVSQPGLVFKSQLFALTAVEPDRQKILIKGGTLKDDTDMASIGLKEGQVLMMMGTAGELPKAPPAPIQFVEDLTDTQLAKALKVPAGLTNLGNTCYMNATLQCLRAVPELQESIKGLSASFNQDARSNLVKSMGSLYTQLENSGDAVTPLVFLQVLRSNYQQFAEMNNQGFMQQDAEECWGEILSALADKAPGFSTSGDIDPSKKFIEQYFTGETISTMTCVDAPTEPPNVEVGTFRQLKANIGSGVSTYMLTDLESNFVETIEKNSETLGRTATYKKTTKITRLPAYLTVNFVRFQWKASERIKAKILKRVKFPFELDVSSLCDIRLLEKLSPAKLHLKKLEEEKAAAKKAQKAGTNSSAMEVDDGVGPDAAAQQAIMASLSIDPSLANDVGCNVSGQYELVAVLTHVGRGANSGHYIGWMKNPKGEWWKFDDDTVSMVNEEEITKLEGGGVGGVDALKGLIVDAFILPFQLICHLEPTSQTYANMGKNTKANSTVTAVKQSVQQQPALNAKLAATQKPATPATKTAAPKSASSSPTKAAAPKSATPSPTKAAATPIKAATPAPKAAPIKPATPQQASKPSTPQQKAAMPIAPKPVARPTSGKTQAAAPLSKPATPSKVQAAPAKVSPVKASAPVSKPSNPSKVQASAKPAPVKAASSSPTKAIVKQDSMLGDMFELPQKWVAECKPATPVHRSRPTTPSASPTKASAPLKPASPTKAAPTKPASPSKAAAPVSKPVSKPSTPSAAPVKAAPVKSAAPKSASPTKAAPIVKASPSKTNDEVYSLNFMFNEPAGWSTKAAVPPKTMSGPVKSAAPASKPATPAPKSLTASKPATPAPKAAATSKPQTPVQQKAAPAPVKAAAP
ncbi:Ubiquitin carboxyl-terminal hydrolase 14, partial [Rhizoclosmatium sp. JEL0117]